MHCDIQAMCAFVHYKEKEEETVHYVYMQLLRPSPKPILPIALYWQNSKLGHVTAVFVLQNSEPTQHSSCKESTAAFVLGCVEGQMSVMFAINRGDVGGGGCTKGHSWSYDSHPTCSYTTIAFPKCRNTALSTIQLSFYYPLPHILFETDPSRILNLRVIRHNNLTLASSSIILIDNTH